MLTWQVVHNEEISIVAYWHTKNFPSFISSIIICILLLPASARLTSFERVTNDVFFTVRVRLEAMGMNLWWLHVPSNMLDVANYNLANSVLLTTSSELTKDEVVPSTLASAKSNNCFGKMIWFEKGRWRLACAASLLMVPPDPSQTLFLCDVAKKSIQPVCGNHFDEISGSLRLWSSLLCCWAITVIEDFVQNWKFVTGKVFIKVFQKTVHCSCVMCLVVSFA